MYQILSKRKLSRYFSYKKFFFIEINVGLFFPNTQHFFRNNSQFFIIGTYRVAMHGCFIILCLNKIPNPPLT